MHKTVKDHISGRFGRATTKTAPVSEEVIHTSATPGALSYGAVVVLPSNAYDVSELQSLITASGGKSDPPAYWRIISNERAWAAQENGTDRTRSSIVPTLRGDNIAMAEHGIFNPAEVTYLHAMHGSTLEPLPGSSILVYSGSGIKNITAQSPNVTFPNQSFYHFTRDPREALLAVITSEPKPKASPGTTQTQTFPSPQRNLAIS